MWTACGWSPKEIGKASTRISSTAISFPNYSNAYECRKYRAGVVRRQRDYPVRIWKPAQRLNRIRPPKKIIDYVNSIMSEWSSINYAIKSVDVTDRQPFSEAIAA